MSQHRPILKLSVFGLAMLNIAAVMSLRGLPMIADTGLTMIFYLLFVSILFLIPCSLVAAELATGWPGQGGIYHWVKAAFGSRWGFVAIWLQWIQNIIWYPTILAFAAGTLAYLFGDPHLVNVNWYNAVVIIAVYWIATLLAFYGLRIAGVITSLGVLLGTLFPGMLIIILGVIWIVSGHRVEFLSGHTHLLPDFSHFSNIAFLAGIVLLFAGMEVGAVHVHKLENPRRQYPKATFLAAIVIIIFFSLGALAIATIMPESKISLTAGLMEAFDDILLRYHLNWLLPILGVLVTFGTLAGVLAWICGPSRGLLATAKEGELPPFLAHTNKRGIQTHILIIQGIIVTTLTMLYFVMNKVSVAFFLLSAMTITLYLVMYILMFVAAIRLRYSHPDVPRTYKIPGGKVGMWLIAGLGLCAVSFALVIAFFPPSELQIGTPTLYVSLVAAGLVIFVGLPLIIHACKQTHWLDKVESK